VFGFARRRDGIACLVLRPLHCNRYCAGFPNESWFSFWVFGFLSVKVGVVQAH
jgi:hypothetical protein